MAGIRLEWAQFGDFDSFDVIRSDAPMDINALPSPIVTNLPTMYYVDTTVVEGATYYYRVVAWRDAASKVSGEIQAKALAGDEYWDKVVALLHFDGDLVDETGLNDWSGSGFTYSSGIFGQSIQIASGNGVITSEKQDFIFDREFTIEAFIDGTLTNTHKVIMSSNANTWINGAAYLLLVHPSRKLEMGTYTQGHMINGNFIFPERVFFFTLSATMENYYIFCDGVLVETIPRNGASVDFSRYGTRLGKNWDGLHFTKTLDELRITKGVARYTENFTPPAEPFPSF
mgnify:CR=1 FL=1